MQYIKIIGLVLIGLLAGLAGGWALFGGKQAAHQHPNQPMGGSTASAETIYTCSMHPQIRQNEPGDCAICGMDLIPLDENSSADPLVLEMTQDAVKLANIQTSTIGEAGDEKAKKIQLAGKVYTDERLASSQVAHVPGRIEKLFVSFTGEQVKQGQAIATIYAPDLISAQRELLEALKLKDISPQLVEAARNKLKYWKVGESTIQAIEQRGTIQESFTITADESGVVTNKRVAVGDYVKLGEPIFDLMNLQKVWVLFDAYEEDLPAIQLGNTIQFTTPAIPNKTFKTRVTFIDPIINPDTRTTAIRTEVDNRAGLLKPAMFVQGSLQQRKSSNTQLSVPKSAVMWTGKRSVVYTRIPDAAVPSFKFKEVQLGESMGDSYQIVEGLEAGDEVVTNGSFTIDAAAQLNNQASMMNKNVGVKGMDTANELPNYVDNTPTAFKKQLTQVAQAYLALKNALVLTKPEAATVEAKTLNNVLQTVEADALEEEATPFWTEQYEAMQAHNSKIIDLSDVEAQRKQFDFLSQALIKAIKVYGIAETTLYLQHCPMANNNEGADWLSSEKKIQNPYFGDKMMKCGLVKMSFM